MKAFAALIMLGGTLGILGVGPSASVRFGFEKFVDELPSPPRIQVAAKPGDTVDLDISIDQIQTQFHRDLPASLAWAYQGSTPGPTIEVEKGTHLRVHWKNNLPAKHIFAVPGGLPDDMGPMPDVRAVTHLHGAVVEQTRIDDALHNNDGWPDAWTIPGQEQIAEYPNDQSARILWYHDHAMASTGRNVAAGLIGMYLIHDEYERSLNLPSGKFEMPLIFQAQSIGPDGARRYTANIGKEFYGNSVAINGKLTPYMNVEPRKYRFRMLNASNARSYGLKLFEDGTLNPGPAFYQIAVDGGFLQDTAVHNDPSNPDAPRLVLVPAERADVIIDFSQYAGKNLVLQNNAIEADDGELPIPQLMLFKVGQSVSEPDTSSLPMHMAKIDPIRPEEALRTRQIVLSDGMMGNMRMLMLNGKMWHDPIEEMPVVGTTEIWELVNTTIDTHPFHIHLENFQVLDTRPFDVDEYAKSGKIVYTGDAVPPRANEQGWKDVIAAAPKSVTRIIMRFGPYKGFYVYHCHILEHEDMDMMRPFQIVSDKKLSQK